MKGQINLLDELIVDNFAGGGGASTGMELATGRPVDIAVNHDPAAILLHKTNHPYTEHIQASVWDVDPKEVCRGRKVGLAWFSPDCKHFSKAKGAALVDRNIRGLAWIVLRWAGTVRPRVIILENVEEFQTWGPVRRGKPVKKLARTTFLQWMRQLTDLGYDIQHRELVAADYGAPTTRKRFFLVARCDGKPIVWPKPTHAKDGAGGLKPWRPAAEIIDWSLPCPSIFDSKAEIKEKYGLSAVRPLADNTMRRIIRGVDKFTIKSGRPFIVQQKFQNAPQDISRPLSTITAVGAHELLVPSLIQYHTEQSEKVRGQELTRPLMTMDGSGRYAVVSAHLAEWYGNAQGGLDLTQPLRTVTTKDREALVSVHLDKAFAGNYKGNGSAVDEPLGTVTCVDHNRLAAVHVAEFKGTDKGQPADAPLRTITTSAGEFGAVYVTVLRYENGTDLKRWPQIRELLNKFCGYKLTDDEVLLIVIGGTAYYMRDIGLRMLTPRELYNAQGFPSDYAIDRDYKGNAYSRAEQVAKAGNSVCPPIAAALARANYAAAETYITTMAQFMSTVAE